MDILAQFDNLLPLAVAWARQQEHLILENGMPLQEEEKRDAVTIGVRDFQRVRVLCVDEIPLPQDDMLGEIARESGFISPNTRSMAIGHGIFVRRDAWREQEIVAHELVHTAQYERMGFEAFLRDYLWQCFTVGYNNSPLEREAVETAARVINELGA